MQITDEMVETAWQAAGIISKAHARNIVQAVAPPIELAAAKAESEACAHLHDEAAERLRKQIRDSRRYPVGLINVTACEDAIKLHTESADTIRARHATPTPSTPQEK